MIQPDMAVLLFMFIRTAERLDKTKLQRLIREVDTPRLDRVETEAVAPLCIMSVEMLAVLWWPPLLCCYNKVFSGLRSELLIFFLTNEKLF